MTQLEGRKTFEQLVLVLEGRLHTNLSGLLIKTSREQACTAVSNVQGGEQLATVVLIRIFRRLDTFQEIFTGTIFKSLFKQHNRTFHYPYTKSPSLL